MKQQFTLRSIIFSIILLATTFTLWNRSYAEGTKELMPSSSVQSAYLQIWDQNDPTRKFMTFDSDPLFRLNIRVCNIGEKIHIGFQQPDTNVYWRLIAPDGSTVIATRKVPKSGENGYIKNYSEATAGPKAVVGTSGYNAITITASQLGDYYIQFNPQHPTDIKRVKTTFPLFDISLEKSGTIKTGRLWTRAWDLQCNDGSNPFKSKLYIYSKDSVVTALNFNGMQPFGFVISANSTGCTATGDVNGDRKSRVGNVTYPEYPIFLNEPDSECFPTTPSFGKLTGPVTISGCDPNDRCINIPVDKAGKVEILLDLELPAGFTPNSKDRIIGTTLKAGNNCVKWNSRDGKGNLVPPGVINVEVNYFNGLTHLPLYDVENHLNGYTVQLVKPSSASLPALYWDDTDITAGTAIDSKTNFTGCSDPAGCHKWKNRGDNNCGTSCPETINTWWYGATIKTTTQFTVSSIIVDANSTNAANAVNDTTVCSSTNSFPLHGLVSGFTTTGIWSGGNGTFTPSTSTLKATYNMGTLDKSSSLIKLVLKSTNNGVCPGVADTLFVHVIPGPTASIAPVSPLCKSNATASLTGSITVANQVLWTGGSGTFVPGRTSKTPTYKPTQNELNAGSVSLTMTTTNYPACPAASSNITLTYTNGPNVSAGATQTKCANNPVATLNGSTNASTFNWTGGSGTFTPDRNTLNATYKPTQNEINAKSVTLTLNAIQTGCATTTADVTINYSDSPTASAGSNQSLCANNPNATLNGIVSTTSAQWIGGSGTFTGGRNQVSGNIYKPTTSEIASGVTLTISTLDNGTCNAVTSDIKLSFTGSPTVDVGAVGGTANVCGNKPQITLSPSKTGATGIIWTTGKGSFVPNNTAASATYTPSDAEIADGIATLIIETTGHGNCNPAKDTLSIAITPAPTVSAGTNATVCANNPKITLSGTVVGTNTFAWSGGSGTFTPANSKTPTYELSSSEVQAGSATLILTASRTSCNDVTSRVTISVSATPTIDAGASQSLCANNPTATLDGFISPGATATWSGGLGTFTPDRNTLNAKYKPTQNEITSGVTLTLKGTKSGCTDVTSTVSLSYTAAPTVDAGSPISTCSNNPTITLAGVVNPATTSASWTGGNGTFSPDRNAVNAKYTPTTSEINSANLTLTLVSGTDNNCISVQDQVQISISKAPTLDAGTSKSVCEDNPVVTLAGSISGGGTGVWSGGQGTFNPSNTSLTATYTPTNAEIQAGSVKLYLTSTAANNCNSQVDSMTITYNAAPTIYAGQDQTICGSATSVVLDGSFTVVSGGTWTHNGSGNLANANTKNPTYTPKNSDVSKGFITFTYTSTTNGSCTATSDDVKVFFTSVPKISAGPKQTVCTNEYPIQLNATGSPATWSGGLGTFSSTTDLNATYVPDATEESAQTVTLTITTIPSGACPAVSDNVTIKILPKPVPNAGTDITTCGNTNTITLNGSISHSNNSFWSSNGQGSFSPNAGTLGAKYVPSSSEKENGAVIKIKLTSTPNTPCPSEESEMTLTITPKITVSAGPAQTICADKRTLNLNGTVSTGVTGTWSIVTGTGSIDNPAALNTIYNVSDADTTAKTVVLKLSTTATATCSSVAENSTFTITPVPKTNSGSNITICSDSNFINLKGSMIHASSSEWTTTGNGTFSPDAFSLSPKYYFSSTDTALTSISFSLKTVNAGTCNSASSNMTVTINKAPLVFAGDDQEVCSDATSVNLSGIILHGATGTWTTNGNGSFNPSATTLNAKYVPTANDIAKKQVTLTLTTSGPGSCKTISDKMLIKFTPAPTVDAGPDQTVCADEDSVKLNGLVTVATGGTWKSSGNGTFHPNANTLNAAYSPSTGDTLAGSVTLTLTTTGMGTCNAVSKSMLVTIDKKPIVGTVSDFTICADSAFVQLSSSVIHAGGVKWSTSGSGSFYPNETTSNPKYIPSIADTTLGSVKLKVRSTGNKSCNSAKDSTIITITNAPTVTAGADQKICAETSTVNLSASFTTATGGIWTTSGNGTITPGTGGAATYKPSTSDKNAKSVVLTFTTTGNGTCKKTSGQMNLTIDPIPVVDAGHPQTICADVSEVNLFPTVQFATGGVWTKTGSGAFGPDETTLNAKYFPSANDKIAQTVKLILTSTGNGLCSAVSDTVILKITPMPTVKVGDDLTICGDTSGVAVSAQLTVATAGIWTSSNGGTFSPDPTSKNATYVLSTSDTSSGKAILIFKTTNQGTCNSVSDSIILNIEHAPKAIAGDNIAACADFDNIQLAGKVLNASNGRWLSDGSGTFLPDANSINAIYSPSDTDKDNGNGKVTLTLITTGIGTCKAASSNLNINFSPIPTISAGPDITVCTGITSIDLNPTVTVATGGKWTTSGTGSFVPSENSLNASYKPSADDQTAGSVILTVYSTDNGACNQASSQLKVSFSAIPTISAGPTQTVCKTDLPIQLAGSGTTGSWSGGLGTFSPNNNTLNATYMPHADEITAGTVTLTLTTTGFGTCTQGTSSVILNITNSGPSVSAGTDITACANTSGVTLAGSFSGASGVKWTTGSGTGTFSNDTDPTTTFKPSTQQIQAGIAHLTLTTTGAFGCKEKSSKVDIIIGAAPTLDAGSDQTVCATASSVQLNATKTVATGVKWTKVSANGNFDNDVSLSPVYNVVTADTTAHTITLRATTTGNGVNCEAVSKDIVVNFKSKPTISAGTSSSVCADITSVALDGKIIGATGATWSSNGTGSFTPNNVTLDANYVPSADDKNASVILTLTPGGTGSCSAIPATRTITFIAPPTLSVGNDTSICSDITQINLNRSVAHAGGVQWTSTGTGTFIGGTSKNATYKPSQADKDNGGATLTITTTGSTPCAEIEDVVALKILPAPKALVNAGNDQTLCRDVTSVKLNGTIFVAGGGKWSGGTGSFVPNDSTLNAEYIPTEADKSAGNVTLLLTTTDNGICAPNFDDIIITFSQGTSTNAGPASVQVCADSSYIALSGTVDIALGVKWSTVGKGTFAPSEYALNTKYYPAPEDKLNGSVGITITTTDNGTCNPSTDNLIINFSKTPTANVGTDKTLCSDASTVTLGGSIVSNTGGLLWTTSGNGTFTNPTSATTTYKPSADDIASTSVILNLRANGSAGSNCKAVNSDLTVNFTPLPTVNAGPDQTICADANSISLTGKVTEATGGVWSTAGSGIFLPSKGTLSPAYELSTNDKSTTTIKLTLKTVGGTCKSIQASKTLTIRPIPVVSSGPAQICAFVDGAILTGDVEHADGGTWSSTGSGTFSPSPTTLNATYFPSADDISSGNVTLTLTSFGAGTCKPVSQSSILLVKPLPIADAGNNQYVCKNSSVTLVAKPQTDVTYAWLNSAGTSIGNSESTTLTVTNDTYVVLEVKDVTGCTTQDTVRFNTYDLPTVTLPNHSCFSDSLVLDAQPTNMPVVPGKFQWFRDNVILPDEEDFTLVVRKTGSHTLTWSYNNCSVSASSNVTEPPFLLSVDTIIACIGGSASLTTTSTPATGLNYTWTQGGVSAGNTQTISTTAATGISTYYVKATDALGCFTIDSIKLSSIPRPLLGLKDSVSCQNKTVLLDATPTNIPGLTALNPVYQWKINNSIVNNTTSTFTATTSGEHIAFVTIDQCVGSDTANITLNPIPVDKMASELKNCFENSSTVTLDAGAGVNLTFVWSTQNNSNLGELQTLQVTEPNEYFVTITNEFNCSLVDSINVRNVCAPKVNFPNAFTPNGTGPAGNEKYVINVNYLTKFNMTIFNRWGEIIFHTENPNESWDGTYRGEPMPVGVYPWTITYEGDGPEFGGAKKIDGSVTLIR